MIAALLFGVPTAYGLDARVDVFKALKLLVIMGERYSSFALATLIADS